MKKSLKSKSYFIFIIITLTIIIHYLSFTSLIQKPLKQILDFKFKYFPLYDSPSDEIILIVIDDSSLKYFHDNGVSFPWPRVFYAKILDYLNKVGVKAVFFDVIFSENDLNRNEIDSGESDDKFANSLYKTKNVYIGSQLIDDKRFAKKIIPSMSVKVKGKVDNIAEYSGLITPIEKLLNSARTGYINISPDFDGVIREVKLLSKVNGKIFPSQIYRLFLDQQKELTYISDNGLYLSDKRIPTDKKTNLTISWYKKNSFKYYPFKSLIQSAIAKEYGTEQTLNDSIFADKIVFVGTTAGGLKDIRAVPIDHNIPGVEIWATILSNFLQNEYVYDMPIFCEFLILLVIAISLFFIFQIDNKRLSYFFILIMLIFVFSLDIFLWKMFSLQINVISLILLILFSFIIIQIIEYFKEIKYKQKLKQTFGKYLSDNLVELISENDLELEMGGNEVEVSVLFSDIYDFTTISEKLKPREIVFVLNEYFNDLTSIILENDGLLDKYTGDGIMAVFGSPLADEKHAFKACSVLWSHRKLCEKLKNKKDIRLSERIHLNTRLAVNSGFAITGNIGSERRMDFTAIGDTVNLAARLEAVNKIYGTNYLISEDTYFLVKDYFVVRKLDKITVKGKTKPTTIYELLGKDKMLRTDIIINYEKAWNLYSERKWNKAKDILEQQVEDLPSYHLLKRIEKLIIDEPQEWSNILKLYTK